MEPESVPLPVMKRFPSMNQLTVTVWGESILYGGSLWLCPEIRQ